MSKRRSVQVVGLLVFLAVLESSVEGVCWSCLPNNLSEEEIDRILAEEFKNKLMEKLGITSEPVITENITNPPEEILEKISSEDDDVIHEEHNGHLQTIILQPLNDHSKLSNTTSFFEYQMTDKLDNYRIDQVTLWLHVNSNVASYEVYEKISTRPRRMIFMFSGNASEWKKLVFTPNKLWLQNPWRKMRIEVNGLKRPVVHKPILQLDLKQKEKRLKKRHSVQTTYSPATATADCHPNQNTRCCRHHRTISLKKHYPWVIWPQTYRAYTCAGDCNLLNYRKNSTWSLLAHLMSPQREPCCSPTAFESLTVLSSPSTRTSKTSNSQLPVLKRTIIKDLVVKSCGCS